MTTELSGEAGATPDRRTVDLNRWGAHLGAGLVAGLAGGAAARVAMRFVVFAQGGNPNFTLGGSLFVLTLFVIVGIVAGLAWGLLGRFVGGRPALGGAILTVGLAALLATPLYQTAVGDFPRISTPRVLGLLLLFAPVPPIIAFGTTYGTQALARRNEQGAARRIPVGWAIALGAMTLAALASVMTALGGAMRHPMMVNTLLGSSSVDFTGQSDTLRVIGFILFLIYLGLTIAVLWRGNTDASALSDVLLLLLVPALLLSSGPDQPLLFLWLPESDWSLGVGRALGLAALLALYLTAKGFNPSRAVLAAAVAAWGVAALWLVNGEDTAGQWTEWVAWGALALAFTLITLARLRSNADRARMTTALLAIFAALWLLLWAMAMVAPALNLRGLSGFAVTIAVPILWLPWLLLPVALLPPPARRPIVA